MSVQTRSANLGEVPPGVELVPGYLAPQAARALCARLCGSAAFAVHPVRIFGRTVPSPRETAWFAPPGMDYVYSGHRHVGAGLPNWLDVLRRSLADRCDASFATILATRYRDGADSVSWHADSEPELGAAPAIAVLSLGATRDLCFRERGGGRGRWMVPLANGDLLLMRAGVQARLQHAVPKRARAGERVSLSFRPYEAPT